MVKVKIKTFNDYSLYVEGLVSKLEVCKENKNDVKKVILDAFQQGIKFRNGNLEVNIYEH